MVVKAIILDKLTVVGYRLEDDEGKDHRINSETFLKLVNDKSVDGVSIEELDGKQYLIGLKIRDLVVDSPLSVSITGKEVVDNKVVGYKVLKAGDTEEKSISIQKAWDLAAAKCIDNAQAMFTGQGKELKKYIKCDL